MARFFRIFPIIVLILLVVFAAVAGWSASKFQQDASGGKRTFTAAIATNGTVIVTASFGVKNAGVLPVSGVRVQTQVYLAPDTLIIQATSPTQTLAPGSITPVALNFYFPLSNINWSLVHLLLTTDQRLPIFAWINATYSLIFPIEIEAQTNYSWGAPFYGLVYNFGSPMLLSNLTVEQNLTFAWANHAPFDEVGSLGLTILSASHVACGSAEINVDVPRGGSYNHTTTFFFAPMCDPSGGFIQPVLTAAGYTINLPPVPIP